MFRGNVGAIKDRPFILHKFITHKYSDEPLVLSIASIAKQYRIVACNYAHTGCKVDSETFWSTNHDS